MNSGECVDELAEAGRLLMEGNHDQAIALLEPLARNEEGPGQVRRALALAYGGKVELLLSAADRAGVTPEGEHLASLLALLQRALELDPSVAALHWDAAVINARFLGRYPEAADALETARRLGLRHPLEPRLEALIRERRSPRRTLIRSLRSSRRYSQRLGVQPRTRSSNRASTAARRSMTTLPRRSA
jgi:tetratricopeptide (TPR) repeat protein